MHFLCTKFEFQLNLSSFVCLIFVCLSLFCFVFNISQDKLLKCPVFRISGVIPENSYILIPRNTKQSLELTGHFFYLLFRPSAGKYFLVHIDVASKVWNLKMDDAMHIMSLNVRYWMHYYLNENFPLFF